MQKHQNRLENRSIMCYNSLANYKRVKEKDTLSNPVRCWSIVRGDPINGANRLSHRWGVFFYYPSNWIIRPIFLLVKRKR